MEHGGNDSGQLPSLGEEGPCFCCQVPLGHSLLELSHYAVTKPKKPMRDTCCKKPELLGLIPSPSWTFNSQHQPASHVSKLS